MLEKIEAWYREAATLHGDDWPNIESYVARKLAASGEQPQVLEQLWTLLKGKSEILH